MPRKKLSAFQGEPGAFSQVAVQQLLGAANIAAQVTVTPPNLEDVFVAATHQPVEAQP